MGFGDLKKPAGLKALNEYLADKSFIDGYVPSQADVVVFKALSGAPGADLFHVLRWYNQVKSYSSTFDSLPGVKKPLDQYGSASAAPAGGDDDSDSDGDLFGDDDDDAEELAKVKAKAAASKPKKTVIAKSNIILDVKPWEDTTNMKEIEDHCRAIKMDGLLWGASKLVPLAYGVQKLQISCVVEDDKVSVDDIEDKITSFETHVQSIDIAAFNKV